MEKKARILKAIEYDEVHPLLVLTGEGKLSDEDKGVVADLIREFMNLNEGLLQDPEIDSKAVMDEFRSCVEKVSNFEFCQFFGVNFKWSEITLIEATGCCI